MSEIKRWTATGMSLEPDDGLFNVDVLLNFVASAAQEYPDCPVQVGRSGTLRVTRYTNQDGGPWLDWRDC